MLGDLQAARDLNRDTWKRHRHAQGPDYRDTLRTAHILAADLRELGEVAAARDLDRDTLERRQRVLGNDHPDTLNSARKLGEARETWRPLNHRPCPDGRQPTASAPPCPGRFRQLGTGFLDEATTPCGIV